MFANGIYQPPYFQCESAYMTPKKPSDSAWAHQMINVFAGAIPLISQDKSLIHPFALGAGTLRVISFYQDGRYGHTAIAVGSIALTILSHPIGMLVTTGHDIVLACVDLTQVKGREAQILCIARIFKNTLYLTLFFQQGASLALASLSLQMGLHLYTAYQQKEWQHRFAYLGLAVVSLALCKNLLEHKWEMEKVYRIQPFPYPINP